MMSKRRRNGQHDGFEETAQEAGDESEGEGGGNGHAGDSSDESSGDEDAGPSRARKAARTSESGAHAAAPARPADAAPLDDHKRIYRFFKTQLKVWEKDLTARPDHLKRTVQVGRLCLVAVHMDSVSEASWDSTGQVGDEDAETVQGLYPAPLQALQAQADPRGHS
jgi:hypothetical protein